MRTHLQRIFLLINPYTALSMPSKQPAQNPVQKNTNRQALEDRCFPLKQQARSHEPTNRNCKAIWESTGIEHHGF